MSEAQTLVFQLVVYASDANVTKDRSRLALLWLGVYNTDENTLVSILLVLHLTLDFLRLSP